MEEIYICDGLFDSKTIERLGILADKVERDSGDDIMFICHHSMEQAVKEAFPSKSVLGLSAKFMPIERNTIWVVPNTKGTLNENLKGVVI